MGLVQRIRAAPAAYRVWTPLLLGAYLLAMHLHSGLNPEQVIVVGFVIALALWSDASRGFLRAVLPLLLFGIVYDTQRLYEDYIRGPVHVATAYRFDLSVFGVPGPHGKITPNEYFLVHHWPAVDFIAGASYILYLYESLGLGFALYWIDRFRCVRFNWTFFLTNVAGFATYYIFSSAPPWYVTQYGLGPVHLEARASPAATLRFDLLTHTHYFERFYALSADVFGAIPSLHVTYPLLVFLYARELGRPWLTWSAAIFTAVVSFSAIYLQHHFMLDVLLGALYGVAGYAVERVCRRVRQWHAETAPDLSPNGEGLERTRSV